MRLYSIQLREVYDVLAAGQGYVARPRLDPQHWLNDPEGWHSAERPNMTLYAYDWLCGQMQARGLRRPGLDVYPVWAYRQWAGTKLAKPDLRYSSMKSWAKSERHVLLELDIPEERVLRSDYDAWHAPLNYWYLGRPRESNDFERRCKARGLSHYRSKPLPDALLHQELLLSWQRIFDLPGAPKLMGSPKSNQVVQATFWELFAADVVSAVEFGAGQARRSLPRIAQVPYTGLSTSLKELPR